MFVVHAYIDRGVESGIPFVFEIHVKGIGGGLGGCREAVGDYDVADFSSAPEAVGDGGAGVVVGFSTLGRGDDEFDVLAGRVVDVEGDVGVGGEEGASATSEEGASCDEEHSQFELHVRSMTFGRVTDYGQIWRLVGFKKRVFLWDGEAEVLIAEFGGGATAGGAGDEAGLEEEGFADVFDGASVFSSRSGDGFYADRSAVIFFNDGTEDEVVKAVEAEFVDFEGGESFSGDFLVDRGEAIDLGKVTDSAEKAIGDAGGAA